MSREFFEDLRFYVVRLLDVLQLAHASLAIQLFFDLCLLFFA